MLLQCIRYLYCNLTRIISITVVSICVNAFLAMVWDIDVFPRLYMMTLWPIFFVFYLCILCVYGVPIRQAFVVSFCMWFVTLVFSITFESAPEITYIFGKMVALTGYYPDTDALHKLAVVIFGIVLIENVKNMVSYIVLLLFVQISEPIMIMSLRGGCESTVPFSTKYLEYMISYLSYSYKNFMDIMPIAIGIFVLHFIYTSLMLCIKSHKCKQNVLSVAIKEMCSFLDVVSTHRVCSRLVFVLVLSVFVSANMLMSLYMRYDVISYDTYILNQRVRVVNNVSKRLYSLINSDLIESDLKSCFRNIRSVGDISRRLTIVVPYRREYYYNMLYVFRYIDFVYGNPEAKSICILRYQGDVSCHSKNHGCIYIVAVQYQRNVYWEPVYYSRVRLNRSVKETAGRDCYYYEDMYPITSDFFTKR